MRHAQQFMYLYCIYGNWKTKYFTLPERHCFDPKDVQLVLYYYYCCIIISLHSSPWVLVMDLEFLFSQLEKRPSDVTI